MVFQSPPHQQKTIAPDTHRAPPPKTHTHGKIHRLLYNRAQSPGGKSEERVRELTILHTRGHLLLPPNNHQLDYHYFACFASLNLFHLLYRKLYDEIDMCSSYFSCTIFIFVLLHSPRVFSVFRASFSSNAATERKGESGEQKKDFGIDRLTYETSNHQLCIRMAEFAFIKFMQQFGPHRKKGSFLQHHHPAPDM